MGPNTPFPNTTMSKHPLLGQPAPALSLPNSEGTTYEYKPGAQGKPSAIFFYPKAGACSQLPTSCFGVLPWGLRRYLRLHERSVRISRCARWYVASICKDVDERVVPNPLTENVDFKDSGITVVGISGDSVPAIKSFVAQHSVTVGAQITFLLLLELTMRGSILC